MKKWLIFISFLLVGIWLLLPAILPPANAGSRNAIIISLQYPQKFNAPKKRVRVKTKTIEISGEIAISIDRIPNKEDIEQERYLVEYFIDDTLAVKTKGYIDSKTGKPSFAWHFNAFQYKKGKHKIIVNFWDKEGPSAIGVEHIIIVPVRIDRGEE